MSKLRKKFINPSFLQKTGLSRTKSRGFTLIELLVVIAIIGILAVIIIVALNTARKSANNAKVKEACNALAKSEEMYYDENTAYATGAGAPGTLEKADFFGGFAGVVHEGTDAYGVYITSTNDYTITGYNDAGKAFFTCDPHGCR